MILKDFECNRGHVFEKSVKMEQMRARCPKCKAAADVALLPRGSRQLSNPVVFYKCADGKYSFPGQADAPPPRDSVERIECRTIQEYDRAMNRVNSESDGDARRKAERMEQANSAFREQHRSELRNKLANEKDNFARDLMRKALAEKGSDYECPRSQRLYSEAMEYYSSNREAEWRPGERGRK
jgi:hypothetical protein